MTLVAAGEGPVSQRVAHEPRVITVADRLQDVPQVRSSAFVGKLAQDPEARACLLAALGSTERKTDLTDGVRMYLTDGRVVHVRPSGNAPELRLYVEAQDEEAASATLALGLDVLRSNLA
jgi:phosphomannomutase